MLNPAPYHTEGRVCIPAQGFPPRDNSSSSSSHQTGHVGLKKLLGTWLQSDVAQFSPLDGVAAVTITTPI